MNKRRLRARKAALRAAYNEELRKMNILDTPNNTELTKAQIIEKLTELGIEASDKLKKDELLKLLEEANTNKGNDTQPTDLEGESDPTDEATGEDNKTPEQDDILDTPNNTEDGEIEDVEIDEIVGPKEDTKTEITEAVADSTPDGTVEEIEV